MSFNPPMIDWRGRTAWLVGASSGIGLATATALHARGARVIVSARNKDALNSFVQAHPGSIALPLDVTDAQSVRDAAAIVAALGPLDCVVYCAGYYHAMQATSMDLEGLLMHNMVNYLGALYMLDAIVPRLLAQPLRGETGQRGHISLMGSVAGYRGLPNSLAYGPTKAALINLAETLFLDLSPKGVGVSLINPGFVDTPLTRQNQFRMPGLITTEKEASEILHGWAQGEFEIHFPKKFTRWMKALRLLPYGAFFAATRRLRQT